MQQCIKIYYSTFIWNKILIHCCILLDFFAVWVNINGFYHTLLFNYLYTECILVISHHTDDGHKCEQNTLVKNSNNNMWLNIFINVHLLSQKSVKCSQTQLLIFIFLRNINIKICVWLHFTDICDPIDTLGMFLIKVHLLAYHISLKFSLMHRYGRHKVHKKWLHTRTTQVTNVEYNIKLSYQSLIINCYSSCMDQILWPISVQNWLLKVITSEMRRGHSNNRRTYHKVNANTEK